MNNTKINLDYSSIVSRSTCLVSANNSNNMEDRSKYIDRIIETIVSGLDKDDKFIPSSVESNTSRLISEMSNMKMASKYYDEFLSLLERYNEFTNTGLFRQNTLTEFVNRVIPYIDRPENIVEAVECRHENLHTTQKNSIINQAKKYIAIDRILENHNTISKRFNIENEVKKIINNPSSSKYIINCCCGMIDTYSLPCYQKMNICLEEIFYLCKKNRIAYPFADITKYISEYFLVNNDIISGKDMKGIRKVLSESSVLSDEDKKYVSFIMENDTNTTVSTIKQCIQSFLISPEKNLELLKKTINLCLDTDIEDISYNLGELLIFIIDSYRSDLYDQDELDEVLIDWTTSFEDRISSVWNGKDYEEYNSDDAYDEYAGTTLSKEYLGLIFKQIEKAYLYMNNNGLDETSPISAMIKSLYNQFKEAESVVYSESNIKNIQFVNGNNSIQPVLLSESKLFKRHNILRAINNVSRLVSDKIEDGISKLKSKAKEFGDKVLWADKPKKENKVVAGVKNAVGTVVGTAKDLITGLVSKIAEATDDSVLYEYIGSDNKLDITLYRIPLEEDTAEYASTMSEFLDSICTEVNKYLDSNSYDTLRCYYEINPYIAQIHLKDATPLILSESDIQTVKESKVKSEEFDYYSNLLSFAESYYSLMENLGEEFDEELLKSIDDDDDDYSFDEFESMLEISSILGVDKEFITNYANKYSSYCYKSAVLNESENSYSSDEAKIKSLVDNYEIYSEATIEDQLEALLLFESIIDEANVPAPKNNNKNDDKEDGEKKRGMLKLNTVKLYLQGLKNKFKNMSQKEKEISKKVDNSFKMMVKGMKDSLVSDRREAIIKGSVIPSFSRCFKIGLGLAGIAKFGHPEVAALGALAGFIASKKLTKKERLLLLDEIEIELDVLDKEIQNAESRGQMKKYRALITQKKSLQRQYQRIKYNVRIGKDIMPNSEIGVSKSS